LNSRAIKSAKTRLERILRSSQSADDQIANLSNIEMRDERTTNLSNIEMRSISVIIITQDEEVRTVKAISSCQVFADEIIVVDGGSRDATVERAQKLGCKVFVNPWPGYAKQRRLGIDRSQFDWIFMIDSDEFVSDGLATSILKWKKNPDLTANVFSVNRVGDFLGEWLNHNSDDPQLRLFNKQLFQIKDVLVHEAIDPANYPVVKLEGVLWHAGFRSIRDHVDRLNKYTDLEAQRDHLAGKQFNLLRLLLKPPARFAQVFLLHGLFQKGIVGFSVAVFKSYYDFVKELKLYEITCKSK
jgi:glycosyltransferase involved in cell wall biosynthesis